MIAKYCPQAHPCMIDLVPHSSYTWRHMYKVKDLVQKHIGWIVWRRDANFWFDNSLGLGSLANRLVNVLDHHIQNICIDGK